MAHLPTNRTTANTPDQHVVDHNELHRLHDILDGSSTPSTGGGAGAASLGGAGVATLGQGLETLDSDGNPRNVLDDGSGTMRLVPVNGVFTLTVGEGVRAAGGLAVADIVTGTHVLVNAADTGSTGGLLTTADQTGTTRNTLDDGTGAASIATDLHVGGQLIANGVVHLGHGSEVQSTDGSGNTRNRLDDGTGAATVQGQLEVDGLLLAGGNLTVLEKTNAEGGIYQNGTTLGVPTVSDGLVHLDFTTPWGITSEGVPYYDPGAVTAGEEAILMPDLTLIQVGR